MSDSPDLDRAEADLVRELMAAYAGVAVRDDQLKIVSIRAPSIAADHGFADVAAMMAALRQRPFAELHRRVADALLNHETRFFRDVQYFQGLRQCVIPAIVRANASERRIRIWSAGCSSGQEPYSVAMMLREDFPAVDGWDVRVWASDISPGVLERARAGIFLQLEVNRGLPARLMLKYFTQEGGSWRIKDRVRDRVEFMRFNLAGTWPELPPMDVILLRNVMIYFDGDSRRAVMKKVRACLRPGGYLILGAAEMTARPEDGFKMRVEGGFVYHTRE